MIDSEAKDQLVDSQRKRGRALTVLLVLFGIFTAIAGVANLGGSDRIAANLPNAPGWAATGIFAMGLLAILAVVGLVGIWKWYRWGAYLYAVLTAAVFGLNMLILGGGAPVLGLIGGATILYLVSRQWSEFE
jgi:hypothetical protein